MDAMQILVVILSVFLALFLLLAIVLTIMLIRVTMQIKRVANTAERAVEKMGEFAANASKFSSPLVLGKMIFGKFKKRK